MRGIRSRLSVFCLARFTRTGFVAIGERSDAVLTNGYARNDGRGPRLGKSYPRLSLNTRLLQTLTLRSASKKRVSKGEAREQAI